MAVLVTVVGEVVGSSFETGSGSFGAGLVLSLAPGNEEEVEKRFLGPVPEDTMGFFKDCCRAR